MRTGVLEQIWQGSIQPVEGVERNRLKRILQALLSTQIVLLKGGVGSGRVDVFVDDMEVLPELALGDVIVEELAVGVPYGSLIFVHDEDTVTAPIDMEALSLDIGIAVGRVLMTVLRLGTFPLDRENEALYIMACAYDRMARSSGLQHLGLVPDEFAKGLVATLGTYWSGARHARTDRSGLFLRPRCLAGADIRAYLLHLDPGFAAPPYDRLPSDLLVFTGTSCTFPEWVSAVRSAVNAVMGKRSPKNSELMRPAKGI